MSSTCTSVDELIGRHTIAAPSRGPMSQSRSRSRRRAATSETSLQYTLWMMSTRYRA
jgi:hypothetical protein